MIEIEMKSALLFTSGSADLAATAIPMLDKMSGIFGATNNPIFVEGHTDNQPIGNRSYPSNWELSAARAASVVHQLTESGVQPSRLAAIAYGEYRPVADNNTENGRFRNRRVVLLVQTEPAPSYPQPGQSPNISSNNNTPAGAQ
jgi:chemotaxis protein MotB